MAGVAKWLTHLTVNQTLVSSILISRPIYVIKVQKCIFLNKAEVVELVDAMDSKSITRNSVGVQVPFSAPLRIKALFRAFFFIKFILISI